VLIRVTLSYAVFGLIVENDVVTEAAPIARWSVGKPIRDVLTYYRSKGATFQRCTS
jgi:hypothetical protein